MDDKTEQSGGIQLRNSHARVGNDVVGRDKNVNRIKVYTNAGATPIVAIVGIVAVVVIVLLLVFVIWLLTSRGSQLAAPPNPIRPTQIALTLSPTPPSQAASAPLQMYEAFDDNCIHTNLWDAVRAWGRTTEVPVPTPARTNGCWDFRAAGFEAKNQRLQLACSNPSDKDSLTYHLVSSSDRELTDLEIRLTLASATANPASIGLQFNLDDRLETWGYYVLRFGGQSDVHDGYVMFDAPGQLVRPEPTAAYALPATVTLRLNWDGAKVAFYVDGREVLTEPAQAYGRRFAVECGMGPGNTQGAAVTGTVDEVRLRYR